MKVPLFSILSVLSFSLISASSAQDLKAKTYKVTLDRPVVKGFKFEMNAKGKISMSQQVLVNGQPAQEQSENLSGELKGKVEVLEVSEKGGLKKCKIAVDSFSIKNDADEEARVLLQGGQEMIAEVKDDKSSFTVEGEDADAESAKLLDVLVELVKKEADEIEEDKAFGTDQPRAVGEKWDVNAKELIASLPSDMPFQLTEEGVKGTVTLKEVKEVEGTEAGLLEANITMKPEGMKGMPPQLKTTKNDMIMKMSGWMPIDGKKIPISDKLDVAVDVSGTMSGPEGKATIKMSFSQSKDASYKPLE